jgi:hypothetical protein
MSLATVFTTFKSLTFVFLFLLFYSQRHLILFVLSSYFNFQLKYIGRIKVNVKKKGIVLLFIEKQQKTVAHSNYSVRCSTIKALFIVQLKKNSVNNTLKRFLGKMKEF